MNNRMLAITAITLSVLCIIVLGLLAIVAFVNEAPHQTSICGNGICEEGETDQECSQDCFRISGENEDEFFSCGETDEDNLGIIKGRVSLRGSKGSLREFPDTCFSNGKPVDSGSELTQYYCISNHSGLLPELKGVVGELRSNCSCNQGTCPLLFDTLPPPPQPKAKAVCGDETCNENETRQNCPDDCGADLCGDGACQFGESPSSCPGDCEQIERRRGDLSSFEQTFIDDCYFDGQIVVGDDASATDVISATFVGTSIQSYMQEETCPIQMGTIDFALASDIDIVGRNIVAVGCNNDAARYALGVDKGECKDEIGVDEGEAALVAVEVDDYTFIIIAGGSPEDTKEAAERFADFDEDPLPEDDTEFI